MPCQGAAVISAPGGIDAKYLAPPQAISALFTFPVVDPPEQTSIAQFWADSPGSVTPPGH